MNIPNLISMSRIFLIPVFLYLIFQPEWSYKFWALIVFGVASITDFFDGWSARKLKLESEFGKFLDPLADKFLVIAALICFLILDPLIPLWMVLVIIGRDLLITFIRYLAVRKGNSIRTSHFGKVKTAFQMVSIPVIIVVFIAKSTGLDYKAIPTDQTTFLTAVDFMMSGELNKIMVALPYWLMFIITVLTGISGLRYICSNGSVLLPPYKFKNKLTD
ncbi:MAG: CDP-diacylglycerol--glycerol-3-phosphate 3-phosphatidyltransferase [Spirochaetes bacterium]|nr:CDP-diacylglycerol--glycerol-3-phosphate 3-phosphatidyltransferase [Spirochaetota bacterium]MBN2771622.1 CDP-diacylglycerol--glycerol-3-phosphate 3-phosphatidyltransferase [Spirochaetota bacterium]